MTNEKTTINKAESKEKAGDKKIEKSIVAANMKSAISAKAAPAKTPKAAVSAGNKKQAVDAEKTTVTKAVSKEKNKLDKSFQGVAMASKQLRATKVKAVKKAVITEATKKAAIKGFKNTVIKAVTKSDSKLTGATSATVPVNGKATKAVKSEKKADAKASAV